MLLLTLLLAADTWKPAETYAVVASIVTWPETSGLHGFPPAKRKDDAFVSALQAAGVPLDHIVYLKDSQATAAAVRKATTELAALSKGTLIFSFQGHGIRAKKKTWLAVYDVLPQRVEETALAADELPALFSGFKGNRLMLFGDFCHSGSLATIAAKYEGTKINAASFTSATASNRSTENWTFTEAVIDALEGRAAPDANQDGSITFAELDRYVHDEMAAKEEQLTRAFATSGFRRDLVIRKVAAKGPRREALKIAGTPYKVGDLVESEWRPGQWYLARIVRIEDQTFHFVHYEGEAGDDDEWVTARRLRRAAVVKSATPRDVHVGDRVCARWHRQWWRAEILALGPVRVRYDDGELGEIGASDVLPLAHPNELVVGSHVLAGWRGQARMFPGVIERTTDRGAIIRWDDGDEPSEVEVDRIARIDPG